MNTFKEVIDSFRICKVCKNDECAIQIRNHLFNDVNFDFVKNQLRIFYTRKIVKINLLTNEITCEGTKGVKSKTFPNLKIHLSSDCIYCKNSYYKSQHVSLNNKVVPDDFFISIFVVTKQVNSHDYHINWKNDILYISKYKKYNKLYNINFPFTDIDNFDLDKIIIKADKLIVFS